MGELTPTWKCKACNEVMPFDDRELRFSDDGRGADAYHRRCLPPKLRDRARTFCLVRHKDETGVSGTGVVAWGVKFPDGVCVTRWAVTDIRQTCVWRSIEDVLAIHGHGGKTVVEWDDEEVGRA